MNKRVELEVSATSQPRTLMKRDGAHASEERGGNKKVITKVTIWNAV